MGKAVWSTGVAAAAVLMAGQARAFTVGDTIAPLCTFDESNLGDSDLDLGAGAVGVEQPVGTLAFGCNGPAGFTIAMSSAKASQMRSASPPGNDFVIYGIGLASVGDGGSAVAPPDCDAGQPAFVVLAPANAAKVVCNDNQPTSGAALASDGTASVFITTFNAAPAAGVYSDTVTVLVANK